MLPPKLTEADLIAARWVDKFDWMRYEPGLVPDDAGRPITFTVAYPAFHTAELAAEFSEVTDGAPYCDSTRMCRCPSRSPHDSEYRARVRKLITERARCSRTRHLVACGAECGEATAVRRGAPRGARARARRHASSSPL